MKKFITNKIVLYILGSILLFVLWWLLSLIINQPIMIFPDPIRTIGYCFEILKLSSFYQSLLASFTKLMIGFIIAFLLALIFGTLAGNFLWLERLLKPTITLLKAIPTVALVFLFLILVRAKNLPILTVSLVSFPILYEGVMNGIKNIDNNIIEAMKLDSRSFIKTNIMIKLPLSIPYILVAIASSFALSIKIEIMAEALSGYTGYGLGVAIITAQQNNPSNMVPVFSYSFIAIFVMLIVSLLLELIKKLIKMKKESE